MREVRIWQAVDIVVGFVIVGIAVAQIQASVGLLEALAFAVALVLGALMIYCFWLILTTAPSGSSGWTRSTSCSRASTSRAAGR